MQVKMFHWTLEKSSCESTAQKVMNCLQEDFFLSLRQPEEQHYWPETPGTRNWRYLCLRQIGRLLGWTVQYPKGDPLGIPAFFDLFICTKQ